MSERQDPPYRVQMEAGTQIVAMVEKLESRLGRYEDAVKKLQTVLLTLRTLSRDPFKDATVLGADTSRSGVEEKFLLLHQNGALFHYIVRRSKVLMKEVFFINELDFVPDFRINQSISGLGTNPYLQKRDHGIPLRRFKSGLSNMRASPLRLHSKKHRAQFLRSKVFSGAIVCEGASASIYEGASASTYEGASASTYEGASASIYEGASASIYEGASASIYEGASAPPTVADHAISRLKLISTRSLVLGS